MRLRTRGHPWHPALAHFPIALWSVALVADVLGWWLGGAYWWLAGFWAQAAGVAIAAAAMAAGFLDFLRLPRRHPAEGVALGHMLAMSTAWLLFLVSVAARGLPAGGPPPAWTLPVVFAAWFCMAVGGWLGGSLVYVHGVGTPMMEQRGAREGVDPGRDRVPHSDT